MSHFTCAVLIIFIIIVGICQCSDPCFYHEGQAGKRCYSEDGNKYMCCPSNDQCNNGICSSIGGSENNNGLPLHISIIIGIGACVFVLVCAVVIGAVYWRREEMNLRDRLFNPFASFSQRQVASEHIDSFSNPNSPTSTEAVVNLKIPPAVKL